MAATNARTRTLYSTPIDDIFNEDITIADPQLEELFNDPMLNDLIKNSLNNANEEASTRLPLQTISPNKNNKQRHREEAYGMAKRSRIMYQI